MELPKYIEDYIREYERLAEIPVDKFPGHRSTCLLNQVAYIGEQVVMAYKLELQRLRLL